MSNNTNDESVIFCSIDVSINKTGISIIKYDPNCKEDKAFEIIDKVSIQPTAGSKTKFEKKYSNYQIFDFYLRDKINSIMFFIFEDYSYGSTGHLAEIGEMTGLYKHYIHSHKKTFDVISPSSVKKLITGNGRAEKSDVQQSLSKFVRNYDNIKWNNFDESDSSAVGIAYVLKSRSNK